MKKTTIISKHAAKRMVERHIYDMSFLFGVPSRGINVVKKENKDKIVFVTVWKNKKRRQNVIQ